MSGLSNELLLATSTGLYAPNYRSRLNRISPLGSSDESELAELGELGELGGT